ncbi:hypothetical protein PENARI_c056G09552 [Penicillium arizonense]|uniref:NmrA-like domain-containing protein n=1 Tax=Penicillium arizonense TaxID=1835702 RepID=A0A1F5L1V7_PENAI|nr:hypothetical protein PENARI_c056G09552 [Penicillium arizonense]OGE47194.1 hypothetical protein PENARI_c056G09552 [Penicillium arizonense]
MAKAKILLTGATGYIGGCVLNTLLNSKLTAVQASAITCILRSEEKASELEKRGVNVFFFKDLDETDILAEAAGENDVVIHTASGFHTLSARALILGLAQRKQRTGRKVYYIHKRDHAVPYAQRSSDIVATEVGLEVGVNTYILMMPTIYGIDTNPSFESGHTRSLIRAALKLGKVPVVGEGTGVWNHVHIQDASRCYEMLLNRILLGQWVPSGKEGIFFVEAGEHTLRELFQRIADAGVKLGALQTRDFESLSLSEAARHLGNGWNLVTEIAWASNSRVTGEKLRELGWKPSKTRADFEDHAAADWEAMLLSEKKLMDSCPV